jgi:hypothetical protein
MVLPIPHARRDTAYPPNGASNQYPSSFYGKPRKDIGETGINPEVHGFASNNNMVLPIPHARRDTPYDYNGSSPKSQPSGFVGVRFFRPKKDIGEVKLDPEVHGFASSNNMV